ncbi:hypothetical protein [Microseira sp. BLCC-F43]|uniref:hypothetical protein n=1 Tax=Microseira sp. BLCC-F43 TaxID=3153602 RepID=UPI0035B81710
MPPIILLPLLVLSVLCVTNAIVLYPLELIRTFSIPGWLSLVAIALVLSWCFGE